MAKTIFSMLEVAKIIPPKKEIIKDISLSFFYGAKIGVLGLNGAGKSTVLRIIAGEDKDYVGEITYQSGLKFGYLPQEPLLAEDKTVKENIEQGIKDIKDMLLEFDELSNKFAEPMSDDEMNTLMDKQAKLQDAIDTMDGWDLDRKLQLAADALNLPSMETNVAHLSGGEKRRIALCRLLLATPDVLLLDEPTNHLDAESVAWLEKYLKDFKGTVIAVTHDRYFLDNVAGWILELDKGRGIPFEGNYTSWLEQKEKRLLLEEKMEASHKKTIEKELEWIRSNPKGRRKKNKARIANYDELCSKEFQSRSETQEIYIPPGPRLGVNVISVKNISKTFAGRELFSDLSFTIPRGAIVGIVGPNGKGKTTTFKMIAGLEKPDSGSIEIGETVQLAYVNQERNSLDDNKTVWEEISDGLDNITVGQFVMPSRSYVGKFNFKGQDQQKPIKSLSGGERNRIHLAKLLKSGGNVLMLDEPTNDLDIETLRALEEALLSYAGTALVISHDRWFLDRVATHILSFDLAQPIWFEGSYSEYEQAILKDKAHAKRKEHTKI